jgi:hypothetical protein
MTRYSTRARHIASASPRGTIPGTIGRECPKCDAAPGSRCFRWQGSAPFQYKVILKTFHLERKARRAEN